jgi:ribonuclease III
LLFYKRYRNPDHRAIAAYIRKHFGYTPPTNKISLYHQAFLHKSHFRDDKDAHARSNERLEFLGDAVLDIIITEYLFHHFPHETEGFLTKLKSKIVNRDNLNQLGEKIDIGSQIQHIQYGINNPRSLTGNAFEALIGAMYLDKGLLFTRKKVIDRILKPYLNIKELAKMEHDFKSKIIIWSQKEKRKLEFILKEEKNLGAEMYFEIEICVDGEIIASSSARTKKEAEQSASGKAWKKLFPEEN